MNQTIENKVQLIRKNLGVYDYETIDIYTANHDYFGSGQRIRNPFQAFHLHSTNKNNKNIYSEYAGIRLVYDLKDVLANLHKFEDKNRDVKTGEVYLSYAACIITKTVLAAKPSDLDNIFWAETLRFDSEISAMSYLHEKQMIFSKINDLYLDAASYPERSNIKRDKGWKRFRRPFSPTISPIFDPRYGNYSGGHFTAADFEHLQKRFRWQNDIRRDEYIKLAKEKGLYNRIERKLSRKL